MDALTGFLPFASDLGHEAWLAQVLDGSECFWRYVARIPLARP